jgi:diguanylate cyclase (GGDEF)-like protein
MVTPMFIMFLILFSSEFLNVKKYLPKIYKPLNAFGYVFGVLAVLIAFSFEPWFEVMNKLASVLFLVLFSVAIYILRKNNSINTKYYLFAMSIYMVSISLMSAMVNGWIENNDINRYSFLFGSIFEILFFTIVLVNRFYVFQNERLTIQKELLELKNKNEIILETKVQDRTNSLTIANNELSHLMQEKELLLKDLRLLAITDSMTKLYNRRYFTEISESIVALSKRKKEALSIIMMDIDKFKNINDTYGHQFGDDVIISLSNILIKSQRKSDIVCRYGGEEFAILLPDTSLESAVAVAEKIRILVESSSITLLSNKDFYFTISSGIAQVNLENETNIEAALKRADDALYKAKGGGRNKVCIG